MHEWSLAESIISTIEKEMIKERINEVKEIKIKIGELKQIDKEVFKFALLELFINNKKKPKIYIEIIPAVLKCNICKNEWYFNSQEINQQIVEAIHFIPEVAHSYIKCLKCGSRDFTFLKGRDIHIESIKGAK